MDKRYLTPLELLNIATQHAVAADYLLQEMNHSEHSMDTFAPIISLMYVAFQLTLRAYSTHEHRPIKEYKKLMELVELNQHLGFSSQELSLLKALTRQHVYHKGFDYDLWENQQALHVFCKQISALYRRVQQMMPLELHPDYQ
jgi:hypothetical protein